MISAVGCGWRAMAAKAQVWALLLVVAVGNSACSLLKPSAATPPAKPAQKAIERKPESRPQPPKPVDTRAQQQYYDRGVQAYSLEKYEEAKEAFLRAIDIGPKTELAAKARENLKKVMQVLKTLDEIRSK